MRRDEKIGEGRQTGQTGGQAGPNSDPPLIYIGPLVFRNKIDSAGAGINDSDPRIDEDHGDEQQ